MTTCPAQCAPVPAANHLDSHLNRQLEVEPIHWEEEARMETIAATKESRRSMGGNNLLISRPYCLLHWKGSEAIR